MYIKCTMYGDGKGVTWSWEVRGKLSQRQIGPFSKWSSSLSSPTFYTLSGYPQFRSTAFSGTLRNIHRLKIDKPMTRGVLGGGYLLHNVTATSSYSFQEITKNLLHLLKLWVCCGWVVMLVVVGLRTTFLASASFVTHQQEHGGVRPKPGI